MLAEKFFLTLETLISHAADSGPARYPDGAPKVMNKGQHVPIKLQGLDSSEPASIASLLQPPPSWHSFANHGSPVPDPQRRKDGRL
jgi:hypothetical protein